MEEIIKIDNVSFEVPNKKILDNVSLKVLEKKRVGIIGPNGSGKTTLLKHVYRALPVNKKTIYINNKALEDYTYKESAKALTVVKQENSSDFDFTVKDIVLLGRAPYRKYFEEYTHEDIEIAEKALKSIGMVEFSNQSFNQLSGGEKQRVLIARSLCQQADIFILDEPTNHLDVYYQWSLIKMIKDLDATVLGVFHEFNLASWFCDYIYVLDKGHVAYEGSPKQVFTKEIIREIFKVDAEIVLKNENVQILFNGAINI